jgi:hypothetical protein
MNNMRTHFFFTHVAFGSHARLAAPLATANLLIEIDATALAAAARKQHLRVASLTSRERAVFAKGIGRTIARDYFKSAHEFRRYPVRRLVDFNAVRSPTYISISPKPTTVLRHSRIWRLAECESDKLRDLPLSRRSDQ